MKQITVLAAALVATTVLAVLAACGTTADTASGTPPDTVTAPAAPYIEPNKPFPQRVQYAKALMKPDNVTQEKMESMIIDLFKNILANDLIVDSNGPKTADGFRMVFRHSQARPVNVSHINVSESQGYGMMILAYMAGCEEQLNFSPGDWIYGSRGLKDYYDAMLRTVLKYPSIIAPHLFTWELFGNPREPFNSTGYATVNGVNEASFRMDRSGGDSATDGDMDIIYSLILADAQWGSGGAYNYKAIALDMLGDLWKYCVHDQYRTLLLGDWAKRGSTVLRNATRPSDFIISHLKVYAAFDPAHDWQAVADACYNVIKDIRDSQNRLGHTNGLIPDFVIRGASGWEVPTETILEGEDGSFGYNACRVPWRLGTDYLIFGDSPIGDSSLYNYIIKPIDDFARAYSGGRLSKFGPLHLNGKAFSWTDSGLFAPPFLVTAAANGADQQWVNAFWSQGVNKYLSDTYADYIKMLVMITASGNYWQP